jgi:hypothetical protein
MNNPSSTHVRASAFPPIGKVDAARRVVYGTLRLTAEQPDKSGEVFDYASGKPAVQAWSDEIKEASGGKSLGDVRAMHDNIAAGKFTDVVLDDDNKRIEGAAKIIDDDEWKKVGEGVYTGLFIGGSHTKRWQDPGQNGPNQMPAMRHRAPARHHQEELRL